MRVAVFCGTSMGGRGAYAEAAARAGRALAEEGVGIVCGGVAAGLLGAVADAALAAGGEVIGVLPRSLAERDLAHRGLSELQLVDGLRQRKARMAELADGFVALPGGVGTLDELAEAWAMGQLGLHRKPCGLLDVDGFWAPLLALADHMVAEGFLRPQDRALLLVDRDPRGLLRRFAGWVPPAPRWAPPGAAPAC